MGGGESDAPPPCVAPTPAPSPFRGADRFFGREAHVLSRGPGAPARKGRDWGTSRLEPPAATPEASPPCPRPPLERWFPRRESRTRNAVSAERLESPPAAAPDSCGPDGGRPIPALADGERRERGERQADGEERRRPTGPRPNRTGRPEKSALGGTKATDACDCPSRGRREVPD